MVKSNKAKILLYSNALEFRLGILIAIFILQTIFLLAQANKLPLAAGYVSDYAGVINSSDKQIIEALGQEVKQKSGAEIAVLTVKTIEPYASIEEFSNAVFQKWGIGEKGKDNGVLIVLSTGERKLRIEVGYGLEGAITDGHAGSIMDQYMVPYFRNNDFGVGLKEGYKAVAVAVAKEYNFEITGVSYQRDNSNDEGFYLQELFGFLGFLIIFFLSGGRFLWLLFFIPSSRRTFYGKRGFGSGFDGGRSGFSGGFRGGFGGFGGGFSGGGGASRRF
jgi:uncharacterized protein